MKDSDVIVNDLLCFVTNFASSLPRSLLLRTVQRYFDEASVSVAKKLLNVEGGTEAELIEETLRVAESEGGLRFAARNLNALPLVVKLEEEGDSSMLVKILSEVQSLRRIVTELRGPEAVGSPSPNPSSTDGAEGGGLVCTERTESGCTNRSGSSPQSIPNTEGTAYSSPESPSSRGKRRAGAESAQGGASLEDTVERLKQKKCRGLKKPESSQDEKSPIHESKSESSQGREEDKEGIQHKGPSLLFDANNMTLPRALPLLHIPGFPNGYGPPGMDRFPATGEVPTPPGFQNNFVRAWFALLQQAHSHNLSQGSTLFPSAPPHNITTHPSHCFSGPHSPVMVKMECAAKSPVSPTASSLKSPNNGLLLDGGGNLKADCSEEGSPPINEISVDVGTGSHEDEEYPSPDDEDGDKNPEWKGLLHDASKNLFNLISLFHGNLTSPGAHSLVDLVV